MAANRTAGPFVQDKMNIVFRADASIQIGAGHIMRCLTLADELKKKDVNINFVCREDRGNLLHLIKEKNYGTHHLPSNITMDTDRELTKQILKQQTGRCDWLIIDHYGIDLSWEQTVRGFVGKIMVIDDLANREHDCDLLLDQNYILEERRHDGLTPNHCTRLLGPQYALLRPQFLEERRCLKRPDRGVKSIFVFMAGGDPDNETGKVLRMSKLLDRNDLVKEVVVGTSKPHRRDIETLASQIPNTICHVGVENMAEMMAAADLAIGAGGTAAWERCCVGLPSIVMTLAENQKGINNSLGKDGFVTNLGWHEQVTEKDLKDALQHLILDTHKREQMSLKCRELVDGRGAQRVVETMLESSCEC